MHFLKAPSALSKSTRRQEFESDTKRSRPCYLLHTADDAWVFPHSQKDDVSRIALMCSATHGIGEVDVTIMLYKTG